MAIAEAATEAEFGAIWQQVEQELKNESRAPEDEGKSDDELKAEYRQIAERRVRLGLILSQLVNENNLQAQPEQVKAQVEDFAQSYVDPREVLKYYYSDRRRLAEVEALVLEENVVTYVLGLCKNVSKEIPFDELMGSVQA